MLRGGRVLLFAIDGGDPGLARQWATAGSMPNLAALLAGGTVADVHTPSGVSVSANWPTIFTALEPDRHGYVGRDEIDPVTYGRRACEPNPDTVKGKPLWEWLHDAGKRTVVADVPYTWVQRLNGKMLVEWGAHRHHHGPHSWPTGLIDELNSLGGPHPLGCDESSGHGPFAPCDHLDRVAAVRTSAEDAALLARLRAGVAAKQTASLALLEEDDWDVFLTVFGEAHCVGHQLWHHHDPLHPRHDPAATATLGGDPVLDIYARIDLALGEHLARLRPDDTVYLLLPHGMCARFDGTDVLDPLLDRMDRALDDSTELGVATRLSNALTRPLPAQARRVVAGRAAAVIRRRADALPPQVAAVARPLAERRWFATPDGSVGGGVRLNQIGRESQGRIDPAARSEVLGWLAARLREVVNLDTGRPAVADVIITDDLYRRRDGDRLADLYVEWAREAPIERVWSPASGTIAHPNQQWRTGGDAATGLLVARGPGIAAATTAEDLRSADVGATLVAAAGVEMHGVDGQAASSMLPTGGVGGIRRVPMVGPQRDMVRRSLHRLESRAGRRGASKQARRVERWEGTESGSASGTGSGVAARSAVAAEIAGLAAAHHVTRTMVEDLRDRTIELEREARIWRTTAWFRESPPVDGELISVVMPTRDRAEVVGDAIRSVLGQSYQNWELLVVNDGSTDETAEVLAKFDDPRIRVLESAGVGSAAAHNVGLDAATGSIIAYLDDDNRFDPDWLKAVAFTYAERRNTSVAYGARLIDDVGRQHRQDPNGVVGIQQLPWDREAALECNRIDMNVLTHRPGPERFDEQLRCYVDWDLLLTLTADTDPVEIPVVAAYYTTDASNRLSDVVAGRPDAVELDVVRSKHLSR